MPATPEYYKGSPKEYSCLIAAVVESHHRLQRRSQSDLPPPTGWRDGTRHSGAPVLCSVDANPVGGGVFSNRSTTIQPPRNQGVWPFEYLVWWCKVLKKALQVATRVGLWAHQGGYLSRACPLPEPAPAMIPRCRFWALKELVIAMKPADLISEDI